MKIESTQGTDNSEEKKLKYKAYCDEKFTLQHPRKKLGFEGTSYSCELRCGWG